MNRDALVRLVRETPCVGYDDEKSWGNACNHAADRLAEAMEAADAKRARGFSDVTFLRADRASAEFRSALFKAFYSRDIAAIDTARADARAAFDRLTAIMGGGE